MQNSPSSQGAMSDLMRARFGLSIILALFAAFFIAPLIFRETIMWVQAFTARYYAPDLSEVVDVIWFASIGIGLFFAAWAGLSLALTLLFTRIAARLL